MEDICERPVQPIKIVCGEEVGNIITVDEWREEVTTIILLCGFVDVGIVVVGIDECAT